MGDIIAVFHCDRLETDGCGIADLIGHPFFAIHMAIFYNCMIKPVFPVQKRPVTQLW